MDTDAYLRELATQLHGGNPVFPTERYTAADMIQMLLEAAGANQVAARLPVGYYTHLRDVIEAVEMAIRDALHRADGAKANFELLTQLRNA
jgi:hypothetical protein